MKYHIALLGLLFSSCLSLKITLYLPKEKGRSGTLELEYRLSQALQNISNYPAPRDNIAPMPLPLREWDFRGIAAQSPGIELLSYSFTPSKGKELGLVQAKLRFASEDDLRLLLGPEVHWQGQEFRWHLSAANTETPDASYPQLDANLSKYEQRELEQFFVDQTLKIKIYSTTGQEIQQLSMADFLTGKQDIHLEITK